MNKYLLVIENKKDSDRAEVVMKFSNVRFEKTGITTYDIWTDEETAKRLQSFSYMAVIKTGE